MDVEKELEPLNDDRMQVGDRVVWINDDKGPEQGTVRKIGMNRNCINGNPLIGVEFDKPIGIGVYFNQMDVKEFFLLNCAYISFIPSTSLKKSEDFYGKPVDQTVERPIAHSLDEHSYPVETVGNFPDGTSFCNERDQSVNKRAKCLPTLTSEQTVASGGNDQRVCYMEDMFPKVDPSKIEQHCEGFNANVKFSVVLDSIVALKERFPQPSTSQQSPPSRTTRLWSLQPDNTPDICRICRRRPLLPCSSSEGTQNYTKSTDLDGNNNGSQGDLQIVAQQKILNFSNCIDFSHSSKNEKGSEKSHETNAASDLYQDDASDCLIINDQDINKRMPVYNQNISNSMPGKQEYCLPTLNAAFGLYQDDASDCLIIYDQNINKRTSIPVCNQNVSRQKKPVHDHVSRLESVFDQNISNPMPGKQEYLRLPTLIGQRIIQDIAAMYPEVDINIIENHCQKFGPDTPMDTILDSLIDDRGQLIVKEENDVNLPIVPNLNRYKIEEQVNCLQPDLDIKATFCMDHKTLPNTQNRYYTYLTEIFPNMDVTVIEKVCRECDPNARLDTLVNLLVKSQVQLPEVFTSQEANVCEPGIETAREGASVKNENVLFSTEIFPEMKVVDIEKHCQQFDSHVCGHTLVTSPIDSEMPVKLEGPNDVESTAANVEEIHVPNKGLHEGASAREVNNHNERIMCLIEMFPDIDVGNIEALCHKHDPNEPVEALVSRLVDYSQTIRNVKLNQEANVCEPSIETAREGASVKNENVLFSTEIFPEMKVVDIEKHCQQFDSHVCRHTLVTSSIDSEMPLKLEGPNDGESTAANVEEIHVANNGLHEGAAAREVNNHNERIMCLIEMFPDIDVGNIEALCNEHDPNEPVEALVSRLVDYSQTIRNVKLNLSLDDIENEAAYQTLLSILPKADPDFLRENFEDIGNDEEKMVKFVENALSTGKYPSFENYKKKRLAAKLRREYREDFNIERFLEDIADPVKYYSEKLSAKSDATVIIENKYLMSRYPRICGQKLAEEYCRNNKNLYVTCKLVDCYKGPFKVVGYDKNMVKMKKDKFEECYKNIDAKELLQEIAFIENEADVLEYRHTQLDLKMYAIARATKYQELLTCNCCYDDQILSTDMVTCDDGHMFCKDCVKKSVDVQVGWGKTEFPCLLACGKEISYQTLKTLLNPAAFGKLMERRQLEEVKAANIPDLETCQFCYFSTIPLPDDKVFTCLNEDCMQVTCRLCKQLDHLPLKCDEVEKDEQMAIRKEIENRMTNALVRECWQCKMKIVKSSGCNKMTCTCGAFMCYLCRQPINDYSHFGVRRADGTMCALRSTTKSVHADAVQKEALKAKAEALARHPGLQLKYDPTTHL